jgi:16S rRNA (cytosine1407-C5)-methyltransferase
VDFRISDFLCGMKDAGKYPIEFVAQMEALLGDDCHAFFEALSHTSPTSIRLNPAKPTLPGALPFALKAKIPWSSAGYYLSERPSFTFDPHLHAGCYYVQEASSMFVEQAFRHVQNCLGRMDLAALDLCAAPGGKSTLLASLMSDDGVLVANEVVKTRASILAENMQKWGLPNVVVTTNEPSDFQDLAAAFDVILTDVPCSGEGMFRKDADAISEWSPQRVEQCVKRQRDILQQIWGSLKPNGYLIYSTCTYNKLENERNIEWIQETLGAETLEIPLTHLPDTDNKPVKVVEKSGIHAYRFYPHKTQGEGFFLCLLKKKALSDADIHSTNFSRPASKQQDKIKRSCDIPDAGKTMLFSHLRASFQTFQNARNELFQYPNSLKTWLLLFEKRLNVLHFGVKMGTMKGRDFVPDPALALSTALDQNEVTVVDLSLKQAIDFLRKESFPLSENVQIGWVLVRYLGQPLGWVKHLGNRANNNYPSEWRIRSGNPY